MSFFASGSAGGLSLAAYHSASIASQKTVAPAVSAGANALAIKSRFSCFACMPSSVTGLRLSIDSSLSKSPIRVNPAGVLVALDVMIDWSHGNEIGIKTWLFHGLLVLCHRTQSLQVKTKTFCYQSQGPGTHALP